MSELRAPNEGTKSQGSLHPGECCLTRHKPPVLGRVGACAPHTWSSRGGKGRPTSCLPGHCLPFSQEVRARAAARVRLAALMARHPGRARPGPPPPSRPLRRVLRRASPTCASSVAVALTGNRCSSSTTGRTRVGRAPGPQCWLSGAPRNRRRVPESRVLCATPGVCPRAPGAMRVRSVGAASAGSRSWSSTARATLASGATSVATAAAALTGSPSWSSIERATDQRPLEQLEKAASLWWPWWPQAWMKPLLLGLSLGGLEAAEDTE